jgi:hypothetical protein
MCARLTPSSRFHDHERFKLSMLTNRTNIGSKRRVASATAWQPTGKNYAGAVVLHVVCPKPSPINFIGGRLSQRQARLEGMQLSDSRHYQD